ncbi:MAG: DUF1461 domain-containing protein [Pseudomonadota bacterium]|nr:DUF1461 domain-containing protein [Pseudomonadota bacterium]
MLGEKKFRERLRQVGLFASLLYLTIWLPLAAVIYLPFWYHASCAWNGRCAVVGEGVVSAGVAELTAYFRHQGELVTRWSAKEKKHLTEVREIYDRMFFAAIVAIIVLVVTADCRAMRRYGLFNTAIVVSLVVVLPFFKTFWMDVFHPLLFDNELWRTNPSDLTWYLTPRTYFKYTIILLIALTVLLNGLVALACRRIGSAGDTRRS